MIDVALPDRFPDAQQKIIFLLKFLSLFSLSEISFKGMLIEPFTCPPWNSAVERTSTTNAPFDISSVKSTCSIWIIVKRALSIISIISIISIT